MFGRNTLIEEIPDIAIVRYTESYRLGGVDGTSSADCQNEINFVFLALSDKLSYKFD